MNFSSSVLTLELTEHIATLWLNRPEKRNAMSREMWMDLGRAMAEIGSNADVRAVVIAARGKSFCVGLDLNDLNRNKASVAPASAAAASLRQLEQAHAFQAAISSVANCPVPVIAAIHSHCIGAGVDLITACDIRLAARGTLFSVRETKIAIVADVGTLQRLPGVISRGHVAELAYTGKDIDAARAEKIGLANEVYDTVEETVAAAQQLAAEIAANSPLAVRGTKFILQKSEDLTTEQSLLLNALWTMTTSLQSNDLKEALLAFSEKRPPVYTGS